MLQFVIELGTGPCFPFLQSCVFGADVANVQSASGGERSCIKKLPKSFILMICFGGLQVK